MSLESEIREIIHENDTEDAVKAIMQAIERDKLDDYKRGYDDGHADAIMEGCDK